MVLDKDGDVEYEDEEQDTDDYSTDAVVESNRASVDLNPQRQHAAS